MSIARALLIDDNNAILRLGALALNAAGWEVATADTPEVGLKKAAELQPDVIVLDYEMPGMSGLQVLACLHALPQTAHIPVVLLTASNDDLSARRFRTAGAIGVIAKPFTPKQLAAQVRWLVEGARQTAPSNLERARVGT